MKHPKLPVPSWVKLHPYGIGPEQGPKACHKSKASSSGDPQKRVTNNRTSPEGKEQNQHQDKSCHGHLPTGLTHICVTQSTTKRQVQFLHVSLGSMRLLQVSFWLHPASFLSLLCSFSSSCSAPPFLGWGREPGTSPFPGDHPVTIELRSELPEITLLVSD